MNFVRLKYGAIIQMYFKCIHKISVGCSKTTYRQTVVYAVLLYFAVENMPDMTEDIWRRQRIYVVAIISTSLLISVYMIDWS